MSSTQTKSGVSSEALGLSGTSEQPYTIFTKKHRYVLTFIVGVVSLVSPLTANLYLPLLPLLETTYRVSLQAIYLTLTLYVVIAAIFPAVFAPTADIYGRRVVALIAAIVYTLGSIGLTINNVTAKSYPVLLLMRALQAVGASASASITYGVISDVCIPAERGTMVGPTISASNLGIVLGPTLGGLIAWRSASVGYVFLALAIFGTANFCLIVFFMPETARNVVGNGNQGKRAHNGAGVWTFLHLGPNWDRSSLLRSGTRGPSHIDDYKTTIHQPGQQPRDLFEKSSATSPLEHNDGRRVKKFPNPLACLTIMKNKDTILLLYLASCNYAVWYSVTASWPQIYGTRYGFSSLAIGLAYLPSSLAIVIAGLVAGPWMNARYRQTAREEGLPEDSHGVDGFPIERARVRGQWPIFAVTHLGIAALGWLVHQRVHPAAVLAVQAIVGFMQSLLFFTFNTLLVDTHPETPSTVSAAASLARSGLSGIGVAILHPLSESLGWGWYFTLLALLVGVTQGFGILLLLKMGAVWRKRRGGKQCDRI
ncbi:major facilitator superfamily domain-containing protein [Xylariaceae sp. FL0255]|nr:major facilitator superfamily domain-containing protein [Xylariaceae sp. FL0255]